LFYQCKPDDAQHDVRDIPEKIRNSRGFIGVEFFTALNWLEPIMPSFPAETLEQAARYLDV
jgi:hypothetical protein